MLTDDERSYDWTDVATVVLIALLLVALIVSGGDSCSLKVSIGDSTTTTTTAP